MLQKFTIYIFTLLLCFVAFVPITQAQTADQTARFKGAIIHRFAKYTTFPPEAFTSPSQRITLGILGDDPFGNVIDRIVRGRPVHGRFWQVKRSSSIKDLWGCHIIFVCNSESERVEDITAFYGKYPVLTIGDNVENFVECTMIPL